MNYVKKISLLGLSLIGLASGVSAQSISDVYKFANKELKGTGRYMGMGGAFTALGGDITTLSQNPAGIGVYRSSEVVASGHIGGVDTQSEILGFSPFLNRTGDIGTSRFNAGMNNFGYVGTFMTGNSRGLISYNVGFAYNRQAGMTRISQVSQNEMQSSLSDYMADVTNVWGGDVNDLIDPNTGLADAPYFNSDAPYLSILGYNGGAFDFVGGAYYGIHNPTGNLGASLSVGGLLTSKEQYHIDEYTFNVGGNINNQIYWGLGVGLMDLNYEQIYEYRENFYDANNPGAYRDNGEYVLTNFLDTEGTGFNLKFGLIARLTSSLRIGASVHTPTWYHLTDQYGALITSANVPLAGGTTTSQPEYHTPSEFIDYRLRTPWRYQVGAAYIFGKYGLLSFDYERVSYGQMRLIDDNGSQLTYDLNNQDIANQLESQNTFSVGGEIRLTPVVSLRLGYRNQFGGFSQDVIDDQVDVFPSGTIPNYSVDRGTQYYTGGFGYRFGNVVLDAAFVWQNNKQDIYLMPTRFNGDTPVILAEPSQVKTTNYQLVLSAAYKF